MATRYAVTIGGRTFIREGTRAIIAQGMAAVAVKFNPHHDSRGRFANGSGGGGLVSAAPRSFDTVESAQEWGKPIGEAWQESLTAGERAAVGSYIGGSAGGLYEKLNGALRKEAPMSRRNQEIATSLDSAVSKASLPESVVAFRGTRASQFRDNFDELDGAVITDRGFISTTLHRDKAYVFMDENDVLFEMHLPKGMHAAYANPKEVEVILPRGLSFRVVRTYRQEEFGLRVAVLEPAS